MQVPRRSVCRHWNYRKSAPKAAKSGCGDLVANVIAVHDWELSRDQTGEYYGRYSASLALLSARIIMEGAKTFAKDGLDARVVVEALISAGVASCIAMQLVADHVLDQSICLHYALDKLAPYLDCMESLSNPPWIAIIMDRQCTFFPCSQNPLRKDVLHAYSLCHPGAQNFGSRHLQDAGHDLYEPLLQCHASADKCLCHDSCSFEIMRVVFKQEF